MSCIRIFVVNVDSGEPSIDLCHSTNMFRNNRIVCNNDHIICNMLVVLSSL